MKSQYPQREQNTNMHDERISYQFRKTKRMQKNIYWGLVLHVVVAAIALTSFAYVASQPTGDEKFYTKYCTLLNQRHLISGAEESKVWSCPRIEWR